MNKIISSIHGNLCGDGCLTKYLTNRNSSDIQEHNRKNKLRMVYVIVYTNNQKELLSKFKNNLMMLFPKIKFSNSRENEIRVRNKLVFEFFQEFGNFKSREWRIPNEILKGSTGIKASWIRSFFDDESTINGFRIIASSVNYKGMKQVARMLNNMNIKNKLRNYKTKSNIVVYDIKRYSKLIGFDHKLKKERLFKLLTKISYETGPLKKNASMA